MNNKILIQVIVPTIEQKYEVYIPISKSVKKILYLIKKSINELTDGAFPLADNIRMYNQSTGEEINVNAIVKNSGLENGSKVLLI